MVSATLVDVNSPRSSYPSCRRLFFFFHHHHSPFFIFSSSIFWCIDIFFISQQSPSSLSYIYLYVFFFYSLSCSAAPKYCTWNGKRNAWSRWWEALKTRRSAMADAPRSDIRWYRFFPRSSGPHRTPTSSSLRCPSNWRRPQKLPLSFVTV